MTYLKLNDTTVLEFDIAKKFYKIHNPELLPFPLRDRIIDTQNLDLQNAYQAAFDNQTAISNFFHNRTLSVRRENAKYILNQLNIKQGNDFETRFKTMILCKALSVDDNYWITNNENEKWDNVCLSKNPLHETLQQIALFGKTLTITGTLRSPEITGQGAYAKAWYRENGELYLYKASSQKGNESEREVSASKILDCFNVPHVKYEMAKKDGKFVCKCKNMNISNSSRVDSIDFEIWTSKKGLDFFVETKKLDSEMFYKMIVVDYLLANSDRHGGNWGFYMNNKTGQLVGMHPLFDHNNAFDENFMKDPTGGQCQLMPGKTQKEAALYAIKNCDFRCIKPVNRNMFINSEAYTVFMKRACELGLYRKQNLTFFKKIFLSEDPYEPIKIKDDNTELYWQKIRSSLKEKDGQEESENIGKKYIKRTLALCENMAIKIAAKTALEEMLNFKFSGQIERSRKHKMICNYLASIGVNNNNDFVDYIKKLQNQQCKKNQTKIQQCKKKDIDFQIEL
ncbi:MAG: hypothetical protein IKN82_11595 [Treponema sp.]|nr:hypothetical protein [Treponema sp.]